jgi:hypothetical protein
VRRRIAAGLAVLSLVPALLLLTAGGAAGQAPGSTGWWSVASRQGQQAPPPPDMSSGDLLVQGGDLGGAAPDLGVPTSPSAVAALRFDVPDGADVGALTLEVGKGARADDLRAYPVKKDDWKPSDGGPIADAPVPDTKRYSQGVLNADGTEVAFRDIARLVTEQGRLSFVLYPGATDRVVLKKPAAGALAVTTASGGAYTGGTSGGGSSPVSGAGPGPTGATGLPPLSAGAVDGSVPAPGVPPPAVAGAPQESGSAPQVAAPSATSPATDLAARTRDDQRTRYLVALEALLVLATFGLLGWGPLSRLRGLTGLGPVEEAASGRGVGRFVSERSGRVVRL